MADGKSIQEQGQQMDRQITRAKEDVAVVGYTTLGTQAAMNDAKRGKNYFKKEEARYTAIINKYAKVKVSKKECVQVMLDSGEWTGDHSENEF